MTGPVLAQMSLERGEADLPGRATVWPRTPPEPAKGTMHTSAWERLLEGQRLPCGTEVQMVPAHPPFDMALCKNCFALWLQILLCLTKLSMDD